MDLIHAQLLSADLVEAEVQIGHTIIHLLQPNIALLLSIADKDLVVKHADRPITAHLPPKVLSQVFVAIDPLALVPKNGIDGRS